MASCEPPHAGSAVPGRTGPRRWWWTLGGATSVALALALSPLAGATGAHAQAWPAKPLKIVVPYAPGGTSDILARIVAQKLGESSGQPVIVENRPGASGNIGAEAVAKSAPDGTTIVIGGPNNFSSNQFLFNNLSYNIEKDLAAITLVAELPNVLVVANGVDAKTVKEFIAYTKAHPGTVNCGSPGNATTGHLTLELFKMKSGADVQHVPYRGSAPLSVELMAGRVHCAIDNISGHIARIKEGSVMVLAVTSSKRAPVLPDVPTMAEAGTDGVVATSWFAFAAPATTPLSLREQMAAAITKAMSAPDVVERLTGLGLTPLATTPQETQAHFEREAAKWKGVIAAANVKIE